MQITPLAPTDRLAGAAEDTGSFGTVLKDLPQEVKRWPLFCIDPTEDEDESTALTTSSDTYREEIDYVVYLAVRVSHTEGTPARDRLTALRDEYLTQLFAAASGSGEGGRYTKVRRARLEQTIGSDEALMDAIVIRVTRNAQYQS